MFRAEDTAHATGEHQEFVCSCVFPEDDIASNW